MEAEKLRYDFLTGDQKEQIVLAIAKDGREYLEKMDLPIKPRNAFYRVVVRRVIDIVISSLALIITLPINVILAIGTYIDVGKPILFKQERVGLNGKIFNLIKFRNMRNDTDENGNLLPPNMRITKWGQFVRMTSLDELLNFWSILKGDMSILGPRPLPLKYFSRYSKRHMQRHLVKPGLECPFHEDSLAEQGWKGRFENDLWYVEHISFKTDVRMMFKLFKKVFSRKERFISASGQEGEFVGYDIDGNIITSVSVPQRYIIAAVSGELEKQ